MLNLWLFLCRGKLPPKTVLKFLRECNPPVGWGKLCPELLAYKVVLPCMHTSGYIDLQLFGEIQAKGLRPLFYGPCTVYYIYDVAYTLN